MPPSHKRSLLLIAGGFIVIFGLIVLGYLLALPQRTDAGMNRVLNKGPYHASQRAVALHDSLTVVDLHADSLMWNRDLLERHNFGQVDVPRLIAGNVAVQAFTIVTKVPKGMNIERNNASTDQIRKLAMAQRWPPRTWNSPYERAAYQAKRLQDAAADSNGRLVVIRSRSGLDAYLKRRESDPEIVAGFLGVEGAHALEGRLDNVDRLFAHGVRMIGVAHFFDNDMGGSAHGVDKGGLTDKGRAMIKRMEELGIAVDLAHSSARTIDDVLAIAAKPVIVSHTGVKRTCNNNRNLSDAQLRAIAKNGGVIGIGYWPEAVCGSEAKAIARAIRHAVNVAGIDHVALGSDFDGSVTTPFDSSGLVVLTQALLDAAFTESEIRKIMGQNALRVLHQTLPSQ